MASNTGDINMEPDDPGKPEDSGTHGSPGSQRSPNNLRDLSISPDIQALPFSRRVQQLPSASIGPAPHRRNVPAAGGNPSGGAYNSPEHNIFLQMQAADPLAQRRLEQSTKEEGEAGGGTTSSVPVREESLAHGERSRQASSSSFSAIERERRMQDEKEAREAVSSIAYEKMEDNEKKAS